MNADRAREVYLELRSRDCWLEKELELNDPGGAGDRAIRNGFARSL